MVELGLVPPKVARRAVRILVLTVRFATARRRATPPWSSPESDRSPHAPERGLSVFDRRGIGSRTRNLTQGTGKVRSSRDSWSDWPWIVGSGGPGRAQEAIKDRGHGRSDLHDGRVSRRLARSLAPRPRRRVGAATAPTRYLSGGRRKPPWPRTEVGEWSPRDEKSLYNWPGRENLQSRTSDGEQVVRLGPLAWLSNPRLAGSSHPAGASPAVPQGAWNALGRPRSRGLS